MLEPVLELSPTPCVAAGIVLPKSSKSLSSLVTANTVLSFSLCRWFRLLNLPKGKSLGRSKPATSSYAQALQHTVWDDSYYSISKPC